MINFDKACSTDEELLAMVDIEEEMARGNKDPGFNSKKKPVDPVFLQHEWKFVEVLSILGVIRLLRSAPFNAIISKEVLKDGNSNAWSALAMLDKLWPEYTKRCKAFKKCLNEILTKELTLKNYVAVMEELSLLKPYLFPEGSPPNSEAAWSSNLINKVLRNADFHTESNTGDKKVDDRKRADLVKKVKNMQIFKMSQTRVAKRKSDAQEKRDKGTRQPVITPQVFLEQVIAALNDMVKADKKNDTLAGLNARLILFNVSVYDRTRAVFTALQKTSTSRHTNTRKQQRSAGEVWFNDGSY